MVKHYIFACLAVLAIGSSGTLSAQKAFDLRCEMLVAPAGIESSHPRLSWKLPEGVIEQGACHVKVASSIMGLQNGEDILWNSGKMFTTQSHLLKYDGEPLKSFQKVFWKVKAWDSKETELGWSEPDSFRMGILNEQDWNALWIRAKMPMVNTTETDYWIEMALLDHNNKVADYEKYKRDLLKQAPGNVILAKSFQLNEVPNDALMYASAEGFYTVYLNGKRVGENHYEPAIGYINAPAYYDVQEVAHLLRKGVNEIRVILARGRHRLSTSNKWEAINETDSDPAFIMQIVKGSSSHEVLVKTDPTWTHAPGPLVKGFFYLGEVYDGSKDLIRQDIPLDGDTWKSVTTVTVNRGTKWRSFPPEKSVREVTPARVFSPASGVWVFDLGEMITGTIRWKEPEGTNASDRILFRYSQRINADGFEDHGFKIPYPDHAIITDNSKMILRHSALGVNLRPKEFFKKYPQHKDALKKWSNRYAAIPTDLYVCSGEAGREWTGTERIHAFRYVEVTGLREPPGKEDLTAFFIHTDLNRTGHFTCSNQTLQRFYERSLKVELMNEHGISSDCWDREKWSWNGETVGKASMMLYNYDIGKLYNKLTLENALIAKHSGGRPTTNTLERRNAGETPMWEQSLVQLPWFVYLFTGDTRVVEEHYDALMAFLKHYYRDSTRSTIREDRWGDHLWAGYDGLGNNTEERRNQVLGTATLYHCCECVKQIALMLNRGEDVRWISSVQERISEEVLEKYYDENRKSFGIDPANLGYGGDSENSLVAYSTMLDEEQRAGIVRTLAYEIRNRGFSLISGTQTMWRTLDLLAEFGYEEEAYRALSRPRYPGLNHALLISPDGIPERFYKTNSTQTASHSHATFCQISRYFHYGLGGIRPDPDQPGFRHFILAPQIPEDLDSVYTDHISPYGPITSSWKQSGNNITWNIQIPPNSSSTVFVPRVHKDSVMVNGMTTKEAGLITQQAGSRGVRMDLRAGSYQINWERSKFEYTAISEMQAGELKVYPNPSTHTIRISGLNTPSHLFILNAQGVVCYEKENYQAGPLDISLLSPGYYVLCLQKGGQVYQLPLIRI